MQITENETLPPKAVTKTQEIHMVKQEHRMCNFRLIFIKRIFTGKKTKVLRVFHTFNCLHNPRVSVNEWVWIHGRGWCLNRSCSSIAIPREIHCLSSKCSAWSEHWEMFMAAWLCTFSVLNTCVYTCDVLFLNSLLNIGLLAKY